MRASSTAPISDVGQTEVTGEPPAAPPQPAARSGVPAPGVEALPRTGAPPPADLLTVQQDVLDKIVDGASLFETLHCIGHAVEELVHSISSAILVFNGRKKEIELAIAPNLPTRTLEYLEQNKLAAFEAAPDTSAPDTSARTDDEPGGGKTAPRFPICDSIRLAVVASGQIPIRIIPILNQSDELLGILLLCADLERALEDGEERSVSAMTQLLRFAIEFEGRKSALQSANDRFASLAASIPGVVYQRIVEPDGSMRYSYISEAARDLFGVPPQEIVADSQALFDCHGADYAATFRDRLLKASRDLEMWDVEATINTRDGRRKYTHAIARPTRRPDGSVQWDGVILDATRMKEAELATAAAEARVRDTIVESMPHGFVLYDADDRLITCNTKLLNLYPELSEVMVAGSTYDEVARAEVDCGLDVEAQIPDTESNEIPPPEQRLVTRLRMRAKDITKAIERRLADGRWILINEHKTADGGSVILHTDVTELKDREAALQRSNKELQHFASVASHDLQEPLRKIEAFGDRLAARCAEHLGEDGQMYIDRMQNAAGRMRSLINDLLSYSRVTTKVKPFVPVDLQKIVTDVLSDLQVAIECSNARIDLEQLPTIDADKTQMRMLFQNLIANAIKFHAEDVAPHIEVSATIHAKVPTEIVANAQGTEVCEVRVKDHGIGFEMRHLDRIFGIFQRLHGRNEYEGTGVGLATCRKIAELHGGSITAESAPGEGTTFFVFLPMKNVSVGARK